MNATLAAQAFEGLAPHLASLCLILARVAPIVFFCPVFGGALSPPISRLALCLALALHLHLGGGVAAFGGLLPDPFPVAVAFGRELLFGLTIGFVTALPFDAARMGGRMLDTFRGANAEAALPVTGSREAATGDLTHQLLCALVCAGPLFGALTQAVLQSFAVAPLGSLRHAIDEPTVAQVVTLTAAALAAGLSIGAPVAATSLVVDLALGLVSRAALGAGLAALGPSARLLLGAGGIFLALGGVSNRLLAEVLSTVDAVGQVARLAGQGP